MPLICRTFGIARRTVWGLARLATVCRNLSELEIVSPSESAPALIVERGGYDVAGRLAPAAALDEPLLGEAAQELQGAARAKPYGVSHFFVRCRAAFFDEV